MQISSPFLFDGSDFNSVIESEYHFELNYFRNRSKTGEAVYQVTTCCGNTFLVVGCPNVKNTPSENEIYHLLCSDIVNDYITKQCKDRQWFSHTVLLFKGQTVNDFSYASTILHTNIESSYLFRNGKDLLLLCEVSSRIDKQLLLYRLQECINFKEVNPLLLSYYLEHDESYDLLVNGDALQKIIKFMAN